MKIRFCSLIVGYPNINVEFYFIEKPCWFLTFELYVLQQVSFSAWLNLNHKSYFEKNCIYETLELIK